ncbi:Mce-associated membrane protein [Rhodococcus sp. PvR044]|jgi:Mce-associated membrane protein|uniref:mce associated protein mas1a n=1 Tax=Rhodococcus TaxID=1827 RepID=UPI000BC8E4BB|nr:MULTISPECIES: mce associated protein mas1a [Rhodococcus]MBP1162748.1 Mce-associated membrane protein [Rhodococcus sp. PvR099]MCZ4555430.1 mce associated protein mas1a [Rhodococcus maanshanensis]PTR44113.1 Mce-associated membrane protein [Rhodococcus sp. OK611]SNX90415.1 Mce-associated membrane protein [Rhodococcus sp. OK270]
MTTDSITATTPRESDAPPPTAESEIGPVPPRRAIASLRRPSALVALLLVLALLATTAVLTIQVLRARHVDALRAEAVDIAREYSVAMSSFDFQSLDANRDAIMEMSTPAFADKYSQMVDALAQIVTEGKGQATATADHVAVERIDDSSALVLVFVDQQAKNVVSPDGNSQKYRMVVSLVREGDRWIVDNVDTK